MHSRFVAFAALALSLGALAAGPAAAQTPVPTSTPVNLPTLPPQTQINPYAKAAIDILSGVVNHQIQRNANNSTGEVSYFKRFDMQIQTGNNSYRTIHLHQGTVINPTGESLHPGQRVEISGAAQSDGSLDADTITIDH